MLKNMYVFRPVVWYSLLMVAVCILLVACGGDSNTTAKTNSTITNSSNIGLTNTPFSPSPTSDPTGTTPTPTRPDPTVLSSRPIPIPTLAKPVPTATSPRPTPTPTPQKPAPTPTQVSPVVVTITTDSTGAFTFSPQTLSITMGTTVIWKNNTSAPHTVTGSSFGSGPISPGGSFSFKFTQAGTFAYHCMFHPYMTASIKVH